MQGLFMGITQLSDPSLYIPLISGPLDKPGGIPEVRGHRVEAIGEKSAIIWLSFRMEGVEMSNVYFFRRKENGA